MSLLKRSAIELWKSVFCKPKINTSAPGSYFNPLGVARIQMDSLGGELNPSPKTALRKCSPLSFVQSCDRVGCINGEIIGHDGDGRDVVDSCSSPVHYKVSK